MPPGIKTSRRSARIHAALQDGVQNVSKQTHRHQGEVEEKPEVNAQGSSLLSGTNLGGGGGRSVFGCGSKLNQDMDRGF